MKLNIGSGSKRYPGYLNIDNDPNSDVDIIADLEKDIFSIPDNSVEEILAHHVLEHLGDGFFHCIKEMYRVCKHNAIIHVHVPHPRHDVFLIDPTHKRPIYPHTLDMFSKARNKHDLDNGGCETPLGFINDVDIRVISFTPVLDPYWATKFQTMSNEECDHVARTFNNVITEYHIQWQVNKEDNITR